MYINFRDQQLFSIFQKLQHGEHLSLEDGLVLFKTNDLISLGKMANFVQQQKSGDAVYFVLNQKIEHTNVCVLSCKFCDFAKKKGEPDAYEMTTENILAHITPEIREVHITGGMPPDWEWERYLDIVRGIHEKFPEAGTYITGNLKPWYEKHSDLKSGNKLIIEMLEQRRKYKLTIGK
ncbi:MAG: hypothetical protein QME52_08230 [Bacteroidota bacterium]|nr:hypothetical protein [Bacteroidota bacterium]